MPHALVLNDIHLIFSTRGRRKKIVEPIRETLWAYIRGIARNYQIDLIAIGGMEDHVHMLIRLPAKLSLANAVRAIKANSSKWMNETGHLFGWQSGYSAFSVSHSNENAVVAYIHDQAAHHAKHSFEEELRAFFEKHGTTFDPGEALG